MIIEAFIAATLIAATSVIGALLFGSHGKLVGIERFIVPIAVGAILSLVLYELVPETISAAGQLGGITIAAGFIAFYILSSYLHKRFHHLETDDCERKNAATLFLIGDSIHNFTDGLVLGAAFVVDPAVGALVAIGIALHEIPLEIAEFGILLRAGYTKKQAAIRNFISSCSVIVGTLLVLGVSSLIGEYSWVLAAIAAGNLLYIATSELLPRVHHNLPRYKGVWAVSAAIVFGFVVMTAVLDYAHEIAPHGHDHHNEDEHDHDHSHDEDEHNDEDHDHPHEDEDHSHTE